MPQKVQAPATTQTPVLQSTAMPRERVGKPYSAKQFTREICRAVQALSLPESTSLPIGLQMIIKQPESSIHIKLVRTSRGWFTEQDVESEII